LQNCTYKRDNRISDLIEDRVFDSSNFEDFKIVVKVSYLNGAGNNIVIYNIYLLLLNRYMTSPLKQDHHVLWCIVQ
jgi:hypothetical protein